MASASPEQAPNPREQHQLSMLLSMQRTLKFGYAVGYRVGAFVHAVVTGYRHARAIKVD